VHFADREFGIVRPAGATRAVQVESLIVAAEIAAGTRRGRDRIVRGPLIGAP
jgi:hypothetical protein